MVTITVHAKEDAKLYTLLINKEFQLRKSNKGSFIRRAGKSRTKRDIWVHKHHRGRVEFNKGLNGSITATVISRVEEMEWQIFDAFISFLMRHFKGSILSINITF